ncbi:MAG: hypothetical protein K0S47_4235 [Herbinix sp.]|nr:hypothetical protein [Herbinix sp.]
MELWDIYDDCFVKTGRFHERGKPLAQGDNHLVVHIFPVNKKGEILIQKRKDTLSWKPGLWAVTGGSAVVGEDAFTACQRELMEEMGVEATKENSYLALMTKRHDHFTTIWVVKTEISIEDVKLQPEEVADAMWATPQKIKAMMEEGTFIDFSYFDFLLQYIDQN